MLERQLTQGLLEIVHREEWRHEAVDVDPSVPKDDVLAVVGDLENVVVKTPVTDMGSGQKVLQLVRGQLCLHLVLEGAGNSDSAATKGHEEIPVDGLHSFFAGSVAHWQQLAVENLPLGEQNCWHRADGRTASV